MNCTSLRTSHYLWLQTGRTRHREVTQQYVVVQHGQSSFLSARGRQSKLQKQPHLGLPRSLWHWVKTAFHRPWNAAERALRLVSPGDIIRKREASHSLPGRSRMLCGREWGGCAHVRSTRAWTSRKNNSLHQGYSLNPPSSNSHIP